jgi:hypothetical protein
LTKEKSIEDPKVMVRGFVQHDVPDALKRCGLERYFFAHRKHHFMLPEGVYTLTIT